MQRCRMTFRFPSMGSRAAVRCELQLGHAGPHQAQGILGGKERIGPGQVAYRVNWTRGEQVDLVPRGWTQIQEFTTAPLVGRAAPATFTQKDVLEGPSEDLRPTDLWPKPLLPEEAGASGFGEEPTSERV